MKIRFINLWHLDVCQSSVYESPNAAFDNGLFQLIGKKYVFYDFWPSWTHESLLCFGILEVQGFS